MSSIMEYLFFSNQNEGFLFLDKSSWHMKYIFLSIILILIRPTVSVAQDEIILKNKADIKWEKMLPELGETKSLSMGKYAKPLAVITVNNKDYLYWIWFPNESAPSLIVLSYFDEEKLVKIGEEK